MTTIKEVLQQALNQISEPLEVEILLAGVLGVSRSFLYTWPEKEITESQKDQYFAWIARRSLGEPIAYILGKKEFWSLSLIVNPNVLIPRPETELVIEQLFQLYPKTLKDIRVLDLGTGSGAIALAIAKECPHWQIVATDLSKEALNVAKQNAQKHSISNIEFLLGDWFQALNALNNHQTFFNIVVSNPPYIEENDPHLKNLELTFEPKTALISGENGLKDIRKILECSMHYLVQNGCVILEHGYTQAMRVAEIMQTQGFLRVATYKDLANVNRVTVGQKI